MHNIVSARYAEPEPPGGHPANAAVIVARVSGTIEHRRANDDIEGGGMMAYLGEGGTIEAFVATPVSKADVENERARRIAAGHVVTIDATGVQIEVQTRNDVDFRNLNGLVSQAIVYSVMQSSQAIAFRDANNQVHDLTPAEMIEVGSDVAAAVQTIYEKSWALKEMMPIPENYKDDSYWI